MRFKVVYENCEVDLFIFRGFGGKRIVMFEFLVFLRVEGVVEVTLVLLL